VLGPGEQAVHIQKAGFGATVVAPNSQEVCLSLPEPAAGRQKPLEAVVLVKSVEHRAAGVNIVDARAARPFSSSKSTALCSALPPS